MTTVPSPDRAHRIALLAAELGLAVPELSDRDVRKQLQAKADLMDRALTGREWAAAGRALADITRVRAGLPAKSRCSACGSPVRWVLMTTGSRAPLDPLPHPLGNIVLEQRNARGEVHGRVVRRRELPVLDEPAFRSHFVTCPYADQQRKPKMTTVPPGPRCVVCGFPLHPSIPTTEPMHPLCVPDQDWDGRWPR